MDFELNADQKAIQQMAHRFADEVIAPGARERDVTGNHRSVGEKSDLDDPENEEGEDGQNNRKLGQRLTFLMLSMFRVTTGVADSAADRNRPADDRRRNE